MEDNKMEIKNEENIKKEKKKIKLPIIPIILIVLIIVAIINFIPSKRNETIKIKSMLTDVTNKSDLETAKITYNVIAKECEKEGCDKSSNKISDFKYVVSCKGSVVANIDFSKIKIDFDKNENTFKINIPKVSISDDIELGSKSFIKGEKLPASEVTNAQTLCEETIKEKAKADNKLLPAAREQVIVVLDNYYSQLIKSYNKINNKDYKYVIEEVADEN
jgi:hypothetical protein